MGADLRAVPVPCAQSTPDVQLEVVQREVRRPA